MRWGRNLDVIITDERSYRSERSASRPEADKLGSEEFSEFVPED